LTPDIQKQRIIDLSFDKLVSNKGDNRTILSKDPGVKTLCVWGELEGNTTWVTDKDTLKRSKGKGDGTVEVMSSSSCMDWKNVQGLKLGGVDHYGLIQRQEVIAQVLLHISEALGSPVSNDGPAVYHLHARDLLASAVDDSNVFSAHVAATQTSDGFSHAFMSDIHGFNKGGPLFILWTVVCGIGFITFLMSTLKFIRRFSTHMYDMMTRTMHGISRGIVTALGGQMPAASGDRTATLASVVVAGGGGDPLTAPLIMENTRDRVLVNHHQWPIIGSSPIIDGTLEHRNDHIGSSLLRDNAEHQRIGIQNREYIQDMNPLPGEYGHGNLHNSMENSLSYSTGGVSMQRPSRLARANHWQMGYRHSPGVHGGDMSVPRWLPTKGEDEYGLLGGMRPNEEQYTGHDMYGGDMVVDGGNYRRGVRDGRIVSNSRMHYGGGSPTQVKPLPRDQSYRGGNQVDESVEAVRRSAYLERLRLKQAESRFNHLLSSSHQQQPPHGSTIINDRPVSINSGGGKHSLHMHERLTMTEEESTPTVPTGTGLKHHKSIRLPPLIRCTPNNKAASRVESGTDLLSGSRGGVGDGGAGAVCGGSGGVVALSDFAHYVESGAHYGAEDR